MYILQENPDDVWTKGGSKPIATLKDEYGGIFHIIEDDHCYVLFRQEIWEQVTDLLGKRIVIEGKYSSHLFPEAVEALKSLPTPQYP